MGRLGHGSDAASERHDRIDGQMTGLLTELGQAVNTLHKSMTS